MIKRLLEEPLLHFLALAVAVFAAYGLLNRFDAGKPDEIIITESRVERLATQFTAIWQRPPASVELKNLIDDYVKEEIFVREALALGLDRDDTIIRRRLRLKMEFLNSAETATLSPTDAELEIYLKDHAGKFEIDPAYAFVQVLLSPDRHGDRLDRDAASALQILRTKSSIDPGEFGDATLLPQTLELTSKASISQTFGPAFAEAIDRIAPGQWTGPVESDFGLHLIRVTEHQPGRMPALAEVRAAVEREWGNDKRKAIEGQRFAALLTSYRVTMEEKPQARPRPVNGP
ncbi:MULTISPECIES: peptidyl-prolyl cis-trans isomerase [Bradyrhizobium]|uniref:peptidylprolyl isomerase n=1 Tax=Bradyrhizobium TaxID=374 RepID=UPI001B8A07A7|nr:MULTISPECIES: peptidylprolyl isomerase [Bradyrhizobium]MBR0973950.1 peptidyl-prolyl cis-trans isomerase [Bradyrhizobium japonicum]